MDLGLFFFKSMLKDLQFSSVVLYTHKSEYGESKNSRMPKDCMRSHECCSMGESSKGGAHVISKCCNLSITKTEDGVCSHKV